MDYIPRTDLFTDLEYLDRYYETVNQTYLTLQADKLASNHKHALVADLDPDLDFHPSSFWGSDPM